MPKLADFLSKITIISARAEYENDFPIEVEQWKLHAYLQIKNELNFCRKANIIAVSDSKYDLIAAHNLA